MNKKAKKRPKRRAVGIVLFTAAGVVVAALAPAGAGLQADRSEFAPLNPEFVRYLSDRNAGRPWPNRTEDGHPLGLIPSPLDMSHLNGASAFDNAESLPAAYDLRTKNKLTAVKDQGGCGSCWAFAGMGSLESFLKPGAVWDFSEQGVIDDCGFDYGPCDGGHMWMYAAYVARWLGPVRESQKPYVYASPDGLAPAVRVQKMMFLPARKSATDNTRIKNAVLNYGAVSVSMAWNSAAYKDSTHSYYHAGDWMGGHAVCVVGWDDAYPKSKFRTPPPGNGAFIVRNSWGSGWGDQGYFYVSYHDSQFGRVNVNAVITAEPVANYKGIYQYDPLGWVESYSVDPPGPTKWFSNIFSATTAGKVKAVSFYTGANSNPYEVYVYTGVTDGQPRSGALKKTVKGTVPFPGYVTIPLGSLVPVNAGQRFSVVVKLTTKGYNFPIPVEYRVPGYTSRATGKAGQSFVSSNGTSWTDAYHKWGSGSRVNVCLKAFTQ